MDFKNVIGLESMLGMCCEGNDSELNYCFMNGEWGDEELIDEWGEEIYKSYIELYDKINLMGVVWYESNKWGDVRFELENEEIKVIFGD